MFAGVFQRPALGLGPVLGLASLPAIVPGLGVVVAAAVLRRAVPSQSSVSSAGWAGGSWLGKVFDESPAVGVPNS
jgi:hypothetical protein